jgi:hypothetical protein
MATEQTGHGLGGLGFVVGWFTLLRLLGPPAGQLRMFA